MAMAPKTRSASLRYLRRSTSVMRTHSVCRSWKLSHQCVNCGLTSDSAASQDCGHREKINGGPVVRGVAPHAAHDIAFAISQKNCQVPILTWNCVAGVVFGERGSDSLPIRSVFNIDDRARVFHSLNTRSMAKPDTACPTSPLGGPPTFQAGRPIQRAPAPFRPAGLPYFAIALSVTACVHASGPGSFLITGSLPPASSTFTVR